jgi:hypothetical protein
MRLPLVISLASLACGPVHSSSPSTTPPGNDGSTPGSGGSGGSTGGGGSPPARDGGGAPAEVRPSVSLERYLPLSVGATWSWNARNAVGRMAVVTSKIEAQENVNGMLTYRVRSTTLDGSVVNWQRDTGTSVARVREQFLDLAGALLSSYDYTPRKLRLDEVPEHLIAGSTWTEIYMEKVTRAAGIVTVPVTVTWTVEAVDEMVTVPAGTFKCLRVRRLEAPTIVDPSGFDERQWFARKVGKVKETGPESKDLASFSIP